jgi:imidazolonepropionase-like amidohydrolase
MTFLSLFDTSRRVRAFVIMVLTIVASMNATSAAAQLSSNPERLSNADIVLRNVHIVDTETGAVMRDRALVIRGDVILAIVSNTAITGSARATVRVIDGNGAYAIPALWDSHVHLMQNGADAARTQAAKMVGYGILHARDMGSSLAAQAEILPLLRKPDAIAPRIISSGPTLWTFTLPYGDASGQLLMDNDAAIDAGVAQLAAAGADFLKVYAGFDSVRLRRLAAAARNRGLMIAGHAQADITLSEQARIGMRTIEHLDFSTLAECTPGSDSYFDRVIASRFRNSGEAIPEIYAAYAASADTAVCIARLREAAAAGLVLTPTLVATYLSSEAAAAAQPLPLTQEGCDLYRQQFARLSPESSEALPAAGRRLLQMLVTASVPVLAGSDAPAFCSAAGSALITELALLREGGLTPLGVLQSATLLPGRLFGGVRAPGQIKVDGHSDILLLEGNPLDDVAAYTRPLGLYDGRTWRDAAALARLRNGG